MDTTALREIADTLEEVQKKYPEGIVDMREAPVREISTGKECGTIHCFAGWYGVAHPEMFDEHDNYWGYATPATIISNLLGFAHSTLLEEWCYDNPTLWGNKNGKYMFNSVRAFLPEDSAEDIYIRSRTIITLHIIAQWLYDVAERVDKHNDQR